MWKRASVAAAAAACLFVGAMPAHAAFPGRNGVIAFTGLAHDDSDPNYEPNDGTDGEIWRVHPSGRREKNITSDDVSQGRPIWSPDGKRILYHCRSNGSYSSAICVMRADGSKRRALTGVTGDHHPGGWSPDGRHIVFSRWRDGHDADIFKMRADGSHRRKLTEGPGNEYSPVWSTRARIAFVGDRSGGSDLYVMRKDGTRARNVTQTKRRLEEEADWSPNGRSLVFVRADSEFSYKIYKMRADGSRLVRLTDNLLGLFGAVWSPNGRKIAFAEGGNYDIYVMNADGSRMHRITKSMREDLSPSWRPRPR